MFVPMPPRPADVYTIRIADHEAQTSLSMSLRKLVTAAGGTFMISLMEGPGFIFRMPTTAPCPLTSFIHGGLLEEGCIHVSKMRLGEEKEPKKKDGGLSAEEESSDAESVEEEDVGHPGLRMQWNWTELNKDRAN
ncbi:uncharacterized protein EKO05_0011147 [Ascochyta rabiei]|uniref:Uncharacterized protein n=1 Tax=Didymella rabiei TaxID=5454 RepID=A0A163A9Q9_DIDRA|nr:uncharacterized protein EKO05_0011147 [Ascochyta rabiei]KZM21066.1 hypothetical protein ST47_g7820 [Ascochyta rabiei]UPX20937.1 hypothetical protein EKO05_0011147 [Ascochyta rabiei]